MPFVTRFVCKDVVVLDYVDVVFGNSQKKNNKKGANRAKGYFWFNTQITEL